VHPTALSHRIPPRHYNILMNSHPFSLFVEDGWRRALDGIRNEIEARYAEALEKATDADRPLLVKQIEAEIKLGAKRLASPWTLW
jgi:hypothetical protein